MGHECHEVSVYLETQLLVGVCLTNDGTRVRMLVGEHGFVLTAGGAEWLADLLNRTAEKIEREVEKPE